jgi:hypothetical protein
LKAKVILTLLVLKNGYLTTLKFWPQIYKNNTGIK